MNLVPIKTQKRVGLCDFLLWCILNISTIILTVLCMYITAPPVNYSILCLSSTVHIVAFVNLLLKKMVVVVVVLVRNSNLGPVLHCFGATARFMCPWPHPYSTLMSGCSLCTRSPVLGVNKRMGLSYLAVKLFSNNSNVCDHGTYVNLMSSLKFMHVRLLRVH